MTARMSEPTAFDASVSDFKAQATVQGWDFWRGMIIGFVAGLPLAYVLATGDILSGLWS